MQYKKSTNITIFPIIISSRAKLSNSKTDCEKPKEPAIRKNSRKKSPCFTILNSTTIRWPQIRKETPLIGEVIQRRTKDLEEKLQHLYPKKFPKNRDRFVHKSPRSRWRLFESTWSKLDGAGWCRSEPRHNQFRARDEQRSRAASHDYILSAPKTPSSEEDRVCG